MANVTGIGKVQEIKTTAITREQKSAEPNYCIISTDEQKAKTREITGTVIILQTFLCMYLYLYSMGQTINTFTTKTNLTRNSSWHVSGTSWFNYDSHQLYAVIKRWLMHLISCLKTLLLSDWKRTTWFLKFVKNKQQRKLVYWLIQDNFFHHISTKPQNQKLH